MSKKNKQTRTQTLTNQTVAVYPGFGLVQGVYKVFLKKGDNKFQLQGLPTGLDADSLYVDSFEGPGVVELLGTSYRAANLNPSTVQAKSVGHKVTVHHGSALPSEQQHTKGMLLNLSGNIPGGSALVEVDGEVKLVTQVHGISLSALPEGLSPTPSLSVEVNAEKQGWYFVRLLYKTRGLAWSASAKWVYDEAKGTVDWDASVKVNNQSGAAYRQSNLKVVAGDVGYEGVAYDSLEAAGLAAAPMGGARAASVVSKVSRPTEVQNLGQVKAYALSGLRNLEEGERQTLPFMFRAGVPVAREYRVRPVWQWHAHGNRHEHEVRGVFLLKNDDAHKLGLPLPSMSVQVLNRNSETRELLPTGGGHLGDAAVGQDLELDAGADFDLKATRIVKNVEKKEGALKAAKKGATTTTRKVTHTRECVVELFNGKDKEVTFVVQETLAEGVSLKGKHSLTPVAAGQFETRVTVAPGKTEAVEFTVVEVEEVEVDLEAADASQE